MPPASFSLIAAGYAFASVVTFGTYLMDKRAAVRGRRRVRERTLHWMEFLGGWPGALAGQACFRHKRRKARYMAVFAAIVAAHVGIWAAWAIWRYA